MNDSRGGGRQLQSGRGGAPAWWIVCSREMHDLWMGGKELTLNLFYTVLLGL